MTPAETMEDLLAEEDIQHLKDKGHVFEVERATGLICVVIRNFPLPAAYNPQTTDLLLRLILAFWFGPATAVKFGPLGRHWLGFMDGATEA